MNWIPDIPVDDPLEDDGRLELHEHPPRIVTREEWGAQEPTGEMEELKNLPVQYLVAMHTLTRPCYDKEDCMAAVKEIQKEHIARGEPDIMYNYLIDMEGNIYIGRGPNTVAMIYPEEDKKLSKANRNCISVAYIGSGGVEPAEVMMEGSASLTTLLFDAKIIDETLKFLWYQIPLKGLPAEPADDTVEDELREHIDKTNRYLIADANSFVIDNRIGLE